MYFNNLGNAHLRLSQFQEALTSLKKATELAPNRVDYFSGLGNAHFKLGQFQEVELYKTQAKIVFANTSVETLTLDVEIIDLLGDVIEDEL